MESPSHDPPSVNRPKVERNRRPSPEEEARRWAQLSVPTDGVRPITEDMTDDDLYAAFVEALGWYGIATETEPGRIDVVIADEHVTKSELATPRECRILSVYISRAQLRAKCWAEDDITDDSDMPSPPPQAHSPVAVGFDQVTQRLLDTFMFGGVQPGQMVCQPNGRLSYQYESPTAFEG